MRILLGGSGSRESAYVWAALKKGHSVVFAPGNAGGGEVHSGVSPMDFSGMASLAQSERCDFTLIGPEAPYCGAIVDYFTDAGLPICGPTQEAAMITEGSKVRSAYLLADAGAPSPPFYVCTHEAIREACAQGGYIYTVALAMSQ
jgi:phosphoribosylamine-glycine ligase